MLTRYYKVNNEMVQPLRVLSIVSFCDIQTRHEIHHVSAIDDDPRMAGNDPDFRTHTFECTTSELDRHTIYKMKINYDGY